MYAHLDDTQIDLLQHSHIHYLLSVGQIEDVLFNIFHYMHKIRIFSKVAA